MDMNSLHISAFIQYSPMQNSPGPWVMDIRFKNGDNKVVVESWASVSKKGCVDGLIEWIKKKVKA